MKTKLFKHGRLCRRWGSVALAGLVVATGWVGGTVQAKPLGQATVTQVNNDVRFKPGAGNERAAKAKDVVTGSDTVRTGQKSQAELEFEDRTITRLGSNSTFTFDPEKREFQLKKGLLLFDMPKGAGGGKIITPAGTAAIEGTAGIVSYRSAPKIICLAGVINVLNPNGQLLAKVMPGQLFIVGVTKYPVDFMLNGLKTGKLMKGGLPNNSQEFDNSNNNQLGQIQSGQLQPTPFVMLGEKTEVFVATASTTQNQYTQGTEQQVSSLSQPQPPPPPFAMDSSTTIDAAAAVINSPTTKQTLSGTVKNGKTTFDFANQDVAVTGNPQSVPTPAGVFNTDFNTTGNLSFQNMPVDNSPGGPDRGIDLITFRASNIDFVNSTFRTGGNETGPSSVWFYAAGNLMIGDSTAGPATLWVHSGPSDGTNPAGLLHLESTGGQTVFAGTGYDPNDSSDILRSHASATVKAGGGVYNGGTIELVSNGSLTTLANGVTVPVDGVSIYDATLDVSAKDEYGNLTSGKGGSVLINGLLQVNMFDTVDINVSGSTPGRVTIQSSGNNVLPGFISLNVGNSTGHIGIGDTSSYSENSGYIFINGWDNSGSKSILFSATGPSGGGKVQLSAPSDIVVNNAKFDISGSSLDAGTLTMGYNLEGSLTPTGSINLLGTIITGNSYSGNGATVELDARYQVSLSGGTDIQANGGAASGSIYVAAEGDNSGTSSYPGAVTITTTGQDGVRLSAQQSSSPLGPMTPGCIDLLGSTPYDVTISASGPAGGGTITASACGLYYSPSGWLGTFSGLGGINMSYAKLDASAPTGSGLSAGFIDLQAPQINLNNSQISAGDQNSSSDGTIGHIKLTAVNPNGTHLGTQVSINNSTLTVGGATIGSGSGIFISGDVVTIDSISTLDAGPAQIYVTSRQNTGGWLTSGYGLFSGPPSGTGSPLIYWSPLYQVMMDNTVTIDLSASTPTISGPSLTSPIYGSVDTGMTSFDLGSQNVLLWPTSPLWTPNAGDFSVELKTTGTFEAQDVTVNATTGNTFSRLAISASGMQLLNSTFDVGNGSSGSASQFLLTSTSNLIVVSQPDGSGAGPSTFVAESSKVPGNDTGGTIGLQSVYGQIIFAGSSSARLTQAYAGAVDAGGTIEFSSSGYSSYSGPMSGVFIGNALIDVSHPFTVNSGVVSLGSTLATQGGAVLLNANGGVWVQDTTTICADGATAGSIQITGSAITLNVENPAGFIRLSAQDTTTSGSTTDGNIDILGASRVFSANNECIQLAGTSGGSIAIESLGNITIQNASLNASGSGYGMNGGSVSLLAPGTLQLQNVFIDAAAAYGESVNAGGQIILGTQEPLANGSQVSFGNGNMQVAMNDSVDIRADGGMAGGVIRITSTGTGTQPGSVTMYVPDSSGCIYLSAQISPTTGPIGGDIELFGANELKTTSLKIMATGYAGGGSIQLNAAGDIIVQESSIQTSVLETLGLPAGQIVLHAANNLLIQDSGIEATPGKPDNFISSGQNPNDAGGSITLHGGTSVNLNSANGWLTVIADGPTSSSPKATAAGQIIIESPGTTDAPGNILIAANNSSGYVRLSALDSQVAYDNLPSSGNIDIFGSGMRGIGYESVQIFATGPAGGGTIDVEAPYGSENIFNASLDASAPSGATLPYGGTISLLAGASLEMDGARVDASSYVGTSSQGGAVNVQAASVGINGDSSGGSTAISADGETAGNISVVSSSGGSTPGNVTIAADAAHYVRLSAQDSATVFNALSTGGNIDIIGASGRSSGNETVQIVANGPAGGGNIAITAAQDLNIVNAQLNASGNISLVAIQTLSAINARLNASGIINLAANNLNLQNSTLTAAQIWLIANNQATAYSCNFVSPQTFVYAPSVNLLGSSATGTLVVYTDHPQNIPAGATTNPYQAPPAGH